MSDQRSSRPLMAALLGSALAAAVLAGCSEDALQANSLVATLPLTDFTFHDTTIGAQSAFPYIHRFGMDGYVNLVGTSGNYAAYALLQFTPAYFPYRDTALVYSAKLTLRKASWFGRDSTQPFGFTAYRVSQTWSASTVTWDSITSAFYESATPRGSYTGPDTGHMTFDLDTAMVREWFSSSSSANKNGIILVPTAGTGVVRGFWQFGNDSSDYLPTLTVIAGSPTGSPVDTAQYYSGQATFVGNVTGLIADSTLLYLQAGLVARSIMHFDVSFVPRGAIINAASLQLRLNGGASRFASYPADTTVSAHMLLSATDTASFEAVPTTSTHTTGTTTGLTVDLRHATQSWVKGPNYGVLLATPSITETGSFNLYTFYGPRSVDPATRPQLKITYSLLKK